MAASITLPIAEWAPDMPALNLAGTPTPVSTIAKNVVPRTPQSYGPLPGLGGAVSTSLTAPCQGAYACADSNSNVYLFAGDATSLYEKVGSATTITNVSKTGGYTCPASGNWHMALFNNRVIATDYSDPVQSFVLGSSSAFANLSASAPNAKYCAVVKSFLVLANINDTVYGNGVQPQWVWWSANNDPTNFPQPGGTTAVSLQSSYNPLYGDGGQITGIVGNLANADGAVFMEHATWRMVWSGPPATFSFYPAGNLRGCQAPNSIVQVGNVVYFLAEDGFYSFDGANSTPIGVNRVDKFLLSDLDSNYRYRMVGAVDPKNKLIFWAYPGKGNNGGIPNSLVIYNWAIDRWAYAALTVEWLLRAITFGYTLDQLYTVLGYTLDRVPYPLSSGVWAGSGNVMLGAFDAAHALNFMSGPNLAATVDTAEIQPAELIAPNTDQRSFISNARPLIDGGTPSVNIAVRNRLMDAPSYAGAVPMNAVGNCPQWTDGRYAKAEITTQVGDNWSHLSGAVLDAAPSGKF